MASWRRITGVAGLAAGVTAAGAGAILAAERIAVGRVRLIRKAAEPEPLGTLRGRVLTVLADDGVPLHVEIDEPPSAGRPARDRAPDRRRAGRPGHHHLLPRVHAEPGQLALPAPGSRRLPAGLLGPARPRPLRPLGGRPASIDRLGADLDLVIKAVAPGDMPVVLVGHSMGGMTIMALAGQQPDLFGTKVVGVALISSAAGGLEAGSPWMPGPLRLVLQRTLPVMLRGAATGYRAILVERGPPGRR